MESVEVTTTVRVTKARCITPAQVNEIVQGIHKGLQAFEVTTRHASEQSAREPDNEKKKVTVALEC